MDQVGDADPGNDAGSFCWLADVLKETSATLNREYLSDMELPTPFTPGGPKLSLRPLPTLSLHSDPFKCYRLRRCRSTGFLHALLVCEWIHIRDVSLLTNSDIDGPACPVFIIDYNNIGICHLEYLILGPIPDVKSSLTG